MPHVRPAQRANAGFFVLQMPKNLKRYYGRADLHFITFSCCRRLALLGTAGARNVFVRALGEARKKYGIQLVGFVVMPEHVHLLKGESKLAMRSTVVHSLKLRVSKRMRRKKLEYMHRNPVTRGLAKDPKDWEWSSYSSYSGRATAPVAIDFVM